MAEVVLTASTFCNFLKTLPFWPGGTAYRAQLPYNCLYLDTNNVLWADCNNLIKATIWGKATIPAQGNNIYYPGRYGLNDLTCAQLINSCTDISTDFTDLTPGECLYIQSTIDHCGVYVGNFTYNGVICNVIEATPAFESGILATYVDSSGRRYNGQGGTQSVSWQKHGKLSSWIDYTNSGTDEEKFWLLAARRIRNYS